MRTLAIASAMMAMAAATDALAREAPLPPIQGAALSVDAEAKVSRKPDMAVIQAGVVTEGQSAAAALADNARKMNALIAALRRAGVAERDIQTSQLSVQPQYQYEERQPPRLTGYQAQNMVSAKVRDVDGVGKVVDAAVTAGGNQLHGVQFGLTDPDAAMDEARRDAVRKARARAQLYAEAAGLRVKRIVSIEEGGGAQPPRPMPMMRMAAAEMASPVAPGEVDVGVVVNVTFELE